MRKIKEVIKKRNQKLKVFVSILAVGVATMGINVSAATVVEVPGLTDKLNAFTSIFFSLIAVAGVWILAVNISNLIPAVQSQDEHTKNKCAMGVIGGLVMIFLGAILTALGLM